MSIFEVSTRLPSWMVRSASLSSTSVSPWTKTSLGAPKYIRAMLSSTSSSRSMVPGPNCELYSPPPTTTSSGRARYSRASLLSTSMVPAVTRLPRCTRFSMGRYSSSSSPSTALRALRSISSMNACCLSLSSPLSWSMPAFSPPTTTSADRSSTGPSRRRSSMYRLSRTARRPLRSKDARSMSGLSHGACSVTSSLSSQFHSRRSSPT
mmetsp:Transcript_1676/g.6595  ORF Transcript_1676/g.6595 Transcript_1676/m.6595 type:complete len:208 (+) Transcript_1676:776-1399(+)